jgi:hypothetical protein
MFFQSNVSKYITNLFALIYVNVDNSLLASLYSQNSTIQQLLDRTMEFINNIRQVL